MMRAESFLSGKIELYPGDCLGVLPSLPENSIDSCVTDPPYGLGFMGKKWDAAGNVAFAPDTWRAVYRVLKPGAHLLAFGGTRTYHRMACAIEDAGFEIRDSIADLIASDTFVAGFLASLNDEQRAAFMRCIDESSFGGLLHWIFGSGFPKSLDVSKAIDKAAGATREVVGRRTDGRYANGFSEAAKKALGRVVAAECESGFSGEMGNITTPATAAARQWEGFGTALKPACEPIVLARKPLSEKTVAANVLRWGTGALNVDGCRIAGGGDVKPRGSSKLDTDMHEGWARPWMEDRGEVQKRHDDAIDRANSLGRWPANVITDGSEEVVGMFPESEARPGSTKLRGESRNCFGVATRTDGPSHNDSGSASRFFYSAKADSDDRLGSKHPTVKPPDLIQYLVRLVTPPGGLVLDCFAGTGTTGEAAYREGMRAVLIEREAEYCDDIRRRMALVLAGPDERSRESAKARGKDKPADHGPLFGGAETPPAPEDRFTESSRTNNRANGTEAVK